MTRPGQVWVRLGLALCLCAPLALFLDPSLSQAQRAVARSGQEDLPVGVANTQAPEGAQAPEPELPPEELLELLLEAALIEAGTGSLEPPEGVQPPEGAQAQPRDGAQPLEGVLPPGGGEAVRLLDPEQPNPMDPERRVEDLIARARHETTRRLAVQAMGREAESARAYAALLAAQAENCAARSTARQAGVEVELCAGSARQLTEAERQLVAMAARIDQLEQAVEAERAARLAAARPATLVGGGLDPQGSVITTAGVAAPPAAAAPPAEPEPQPVQPPEKAEPVMPEHDDLWILAFADPVHVALTAPGQPLVRLPAAIAPLDAEGCVVLSQARPGMPRGTRACRPAPGTPRPMASEPLAEVPPEDQASQGEAS